MAKQSAANVSLSDWLRERSDSYRTLMISRDEGYGVTSTAARYRCINIASDVGKSISFRASSKFPC